MRHDIGKTKVLMGSNGEGVQIKLFKAQKPSVLLSDEILYGKPTWRRHRSAVVWVEA